MQYQSFVETVFILESSLCAHIATIFGVLHFFPVYFQTEAFSIFRDTFTQNDFIKLYFIQKPWRGMDCGILINSF